MSLVNPTDTITTGPFKSLSLFFSEVTLCVKISSSLSVSLCQRVIWNRLHTYIIYSVQFLNVFVGIITVYTSKLWSRQTVEIYKHCLAVSMFVLCHRQ